MSKIFHFQILGKMVTVLFK